MILLASQSSGRLATLRAAGVDPLVLVSRIDEDAVLEALMRCDPGAGPAQQVQELARAKAREVASRTSAKEAGIVVGCDSMLEIGGAVVGKPACAQEARERWISMRGTSGTLHSGHFLVRTADGASAQGVSSTTVHFGEPSLEEIDAYIATGEPLWCAGAFTIDGLGGAFIDGVEGDPHGVVGISLPLLRRLLAQLGVIWTDLWAPPSAVPDAGA